MSEVSVDNNHFSIDKQIKCFEKGTKYVKLLRAAMAGTGVKTYGREDKQDFIRLYEELASELDVVKFVPASGAATRMFKEMHTWIEVPKQHNKKVNAFFKNVEELPFFERWLEKCNELDIETYQAGIASKISWLKVLLLDHGLNYSSLPKGVIPFHIYDGLEATPVDEHLREAKELSLGEKALIHFTISPKFQNDFDKAVENARSNQGIDENSVEINYSTQDSETDTIALDKDGEVIMKDGSRYRRPGGHGALIQNLNAIDADIIFIKNIDNVVHKRLLHDTIRYKKLLGGVLLDIRADFKRIHDQISKGLVDEVSIDAARDKWGMRIPRDYQKVTEYLKRPIRVCGMVKNEGEPGGGPFWTLDKYTGESLQIVEQSQIDKSNMRQEMILKSATYFNPVDIVCSTKALDGSRIDLYKYVDEDQYFITDKSVDGKSINALEWPGLWNGAMAHWITVFVEVPITTFNPVKEVGDLLRRSHQP